MQSAPDVFDTKLLSLMTTVVDAAVQAATHAGLASGEHARNVTVRRVIAAVIGGERDMQRLQRCALGKAFRRAATVPTLLPVAHRCSA